MMRVCSYSALGFVVLLVVAYVVSGSTAPVPEEKPVLKCDLTWTGKYGDEPSQDGGIVAITNLSSEDIDIGTANGPKANLDFQIKDPDGMKVKTEPYKFSFSNGGKAKPYILMPGKIYKHYVNLLVVIPKKDLISGKYKVKALYEYKGKVYESKEVEVEWSTKRK